jgi:transposase-like protein
MNRDAEAHTEATRAGVRASMARGVRFGARPRFNDATMALIRREVEAGVPVRKLAVAIGVSEACVFKWKRNWRKESQDG